MAAGKKRTGGAGVVTGQVEADDGSATRPPGRQGSGRSAARGGAGTEVQTQERMAKSRSDKVIRGVRRNGVEGVHATESGPEHTRKGG